MCELFGMSSRLPATVNLSLETFARHGGQTDHHKDGWGVAWFAQDDALVIREPRAAASSAQMHFVSTQDFESTFVLSHIRRATVGELALRNTQPFSRELGGRLHVFAHNGMLEGLWDRYTLSGRFQPLGETDSEYAFCLLMDRMAAIWQDRRSPPGTQARLEIFQTFVKEMAELGPANFIYSDGEVMLAHANRRTHPDGIHPPGLYYLCRKCESEPKPVDTTSLRISTLADSQDIVLLASVPLTEEHWSAVGEGEVLMLERGMVVSKN
ncbi:MAG TPA: class II glutamine amidotransferase [Pseudomonadales bacterium]|nr:class II glutamine amidotransferase [Pseudomonadales bacterium]